MLKRFSTDTTGVPEVLLDGASPTFYAKLLDPPNFQWNPSGKLEWCHISGDNEGRVRLTTKVEVTGGNLVDVPMETWHQIFCHVIVDHLRGKFLEDATESLAGAYEWQREQSQLVPHAPQLRSMPMSHLQQLQTASFVFPDPDEE